MASVRLTPGKGAFHIRKLLDGSLENACLCVHNADFSVSGCMAQVPGPLVEMVMGGNGSYPEEERESLKQKNGGRLPDMRCIYCYAKRHNTGKATPLDVDEGTIAEFEEKRPEIVRLGKNTEVGHLLYRKTLVDFLSLCEKFKTQIIMPTKMLEFDLRLVDLFREVGGVVLYSIGYDELEQGAGSQGFYNAWRVRQAEAYHQAGVNTALTVVCDVTSSIDANAKKGSAIKLALNSLPSLPKRILPMRLISKKLARKVTGFYWGDLLTPPHEGQTSF